MNLSIGAIGAVCLVLFWVLHRRDRLPGFRAFLAFVGVCLVAGGASGALGFDLLVKAVGWVESLLSDLTAALIGIRIGPLVLLVLLGADFLLALHPKNKAEKRTGWVGIALALVLLAGVAQVPALNNVPANVRNGVGNAQSSIQSGGH